MAPHGHEHHSGWSTPGKFYKGRSQERTRLGLPDISLLVPEAKDRVSHGEPLGGGIHEEESKAGKIKSCETKLGLPDVEHAKLAVLVSLRSPESQRSYRRSIDDFVSWYCSEPRLSFNKTVVTRYRIHLEDQSLAPGTINVRLAAVRRLAYEAADTGLLSPELAAGIRRVKGAKKLGMRLGNWLTIPEARALWQLPNRHTVKGKRDRAMLAVLLGCG